MIQTYDHHASIDLAGGLHTPLLLEIVWGLGWAGQFREGDSKFFGHPTHLTLKPKTEGEQIIWKIHLGMTTLGTLRFVQVTTCHANLLKQKQDMSHEQANFQNSLFCSCLLSGRITTAINTANDYTDDVLQNGFGYKPCLVN